eukprot:1852172-Pleurochrysis_carterae.AAC.1
MQQRVGKKVGTDAKSASSGGGGRGVLVMVAPQHSAEHWIRLTASGQTPKAYDDQSDLGPRRRVPRRGRMHARALAHSPSWHLRLAFTVRQRLKD